MLHFFMKFFILKGKMREKQPAQTEFIQIELEVIKKWKEPDGTIHIIGRPIIPEDILQDIFKGLHRTEYELLEVTINKIFTSLFPDLKKLKIPRALYASYRTVRAKREKFFEHYGGLDTPGLEMSASEIMSTLECIAAYLAFKENEVDYGLGVLFHVAIAWDGKLKKVLRPMLKSLFKYLNKLLDEELPDKGLIYFSDESELLGEADLEEPGTSSQFSREDSRNAFIHYVERAKREFFSINAKTILYDMGVKPREIKRIIHIGEKRDQRITLTDAERVYLHRFREKYGPAWRKFKSEGNLSSSLFP